uniref:Uncharacterized protein n=1 Tax=Rhizophora mucronata TaxID=61149 RepID=A0A2P2NRA8_RHIMU
MEQSLPYVVVNCKLCALTVVRWFQKRGRCIGPLPKLVSIQKLGAIMVYGPAPTRTENLNGTLPSQF